MSGVESLVTQVKQPGQEDVHSRQNISKNEKRSCFSRVLCCLGNDDDTTSISSEERQTTSHATKQASQSPQPDKTFVVPIQQQRPDPNLHQGPQSYSPDEYDVGNMLPPRNGWLLPPLTPENRHKKCLVLDLDETLVHSSFKLIDDHDFEILIPLEQQMHCVYVRKRPFVDKFLRHVAKKWEVIIFTASLSKYADPLLDILDANRVVETRLFRESCVFHNGNYVKDLTMLGRRLENTVIVDNSPLSYMFQTDNAIPITSWFVEKSDRQLDDLLAFLDQLADCPDVMEMLRRTKMHFETGGYVPPPENSSIISVQDEDNN